MSQANLLRFLFAAGFCLLVYLWQGGFFSLWDGVVPADGFFLIFIFEWEGMDWLGGRLPGVYLCAVFSLFPLALILDWLPCQSPRTYVLADGFFFNFHFFVERMDWLGVCLPRVYLSAVFSLFPLALILDWLPCQSPRAEAGSRLPAFASPPNPLSEKQC